LCGEYAGKSCQENKVENLDSRKKSNLENSDLELFS
jgi:hypothetical protein